MSVVSKPSACPACGGDQIQAIGRAEAGEFGLSEDIEIYECSACGNEWDNAMDPGAR